MTSFIDLKSVGVARAIFSDPSEAKDAVTAKVGAIIAAFGLISDMVWVATVHFLLKLDQSWCSSGYLKLSQDRGCCNLHLRKLTDEDGKDVKFPVVKLNDRGME